MLHKPIVNSDIEILYTALGWWTPVVSIPHLSLYRLHAVLIILNFVSSLPRPIPFLSSSAPDSKMHLFLFT